MLLYYCTLFCIHMYLAVEKKAKTNTKKLQSRNYQDAKRKHIAKPGDLILNKIGQNTRD